MHMQREATNRTMGNGRRCGISVLFACVAGLSALASTCIVSYPAGEMDPKSSMMSETVSVDAGAGTCTVMDSSLEARFRTFGASLGIALTTGPLGSIFSIR